MREWRWGNEGVRGWGCEGMRVWGGPTCFWRWRCFARGWLEVCGSRQQSHIAGGTPRSAWSAGWHSPPLRLQTSRSAGRGKGIEEGRKEEWREKGGREEGVEERRGEGKSKESRGEGKGRGVEWGKGKGKGKGKAERTRRRGLGQGGILFKINLSLRQHMLKVKCLISCTIRTSVTIN